MQPDKSLELLAKQSNKDLLNLSSWFRANKLCLNVQKTELMIFCPNNLKIESAFKFKLKEKRLIQTQSINYRA